VSGTGNAIPHVIEQANQKAIELFGAREASELLGPTFVVWQKDQDVLRRILTAWKGQDTFQSEMKIETLDGQVRDVLVTINRPVASDPDKNFLAFIDITERKRAEEAQRNSEGRYRHLFEHLPIAIWQFDLRDVAALLDSLRSGGMTSLGAHLDGDPDLLYRLMDALICEDVNEQAVKMFGARERAELLGRCGHLRRRSPDTFRRAIESRLRGDPMFQEETKFITFDGREIDVLFSTARFGPGDGLPSALVGLVDITEQNRAKDRLQQMQAAAERELQLTIDTIPTMVATFQPDGRCDFVNKVWRDYFGPGSQDATVERQYRLFPMHPDDAEAAEKAWHDSLTGGQPLLLEVRLRGSNGKHRWHTIRRVPLRDASGSIVKWYGVAFEIEDQKVAENALRQSQMLLANTKRELQATLDSIPTLAWRTRPDGFTEYLNKRWLDFTGNSLEDALGWQWQSAIHPDDLPNLTRTWREILASGKSGEVEARMRRFDGVYRWFSFRAEPLRDAIGTIVAWYGTNTDIEDSKRYRDVQMELAHMNRLATMGQLTASIAHETYQPITGTVASADAALRWLDSRPPNLEEVRRALDHIMKAGIRAGEVIDRIRALIRKAPSRKESVDINEAVGEVVALTRGEAAKMASRSRCSWQTRSRSFRAIECNCSRWCST
jgi:PAS domain S-box-containing protein